MKFFLATAAAGLACAAAGASIEMEAKAQNWVVIAAGSKTYGNYRHQADACHAYQIAKKGGVPESNIILMMEDDIANNVENPFPGKMFNKPTAKGVPGVDVYDGCEVDYKGSVVTAKLFLDVLQGKQSEVDGLGSGKVVNGGPNDKVFVNFVDHGGTGIVEFPNGDFLHATDLNTALKNMASNDQFGKLVFYMEACESGSMFSTLLPKDINVYATTASNPSESSWGTYCPPDDKVDGKELNSCLGDLYSVNWMEDCDKTGLTRTLEGQFKAVKKLTNKSHVMEYGTMTFSETDKVGDYLAPGSSAEEVEEEEEKDGLKKSATVEAHDIELVQDFYKYLRADAQGKTAEEKDALADELVAVIQARQAADAKFASLGDIVSATATDFDASDEGMDADCVKAAYTTFQDKCGTLDSYSLKYSHQVADLCITYSADSIDAILTTLCE